MKKTDSNALKLAAVFGLADTVYEYRSIDTGTLKGLRYAERLHQSDDWEIVRSTPFSVTFQRHVARKS